jgi:uncharacterized protein
MEPMSLNNKTFSLPSDARQKLRDVARDSIRHGLENGEPVPINPDDHAPPLQQMGASFVTLERGKRLRGCLGTVNACRPLIRDVAENAYGSAFRDPRFPPLIPTEFDDLTITISVLSPPSLITFQSEEDLLSQLLPGIDGLILEEGAHRSTFLPLVWESLPTPRTFLQELKRKAGLPAGYWSTSLRVLRYTAEKV